MLLPSPRTATYAMAAIADASTIRPITISSIFRGLLQINQGSLVRPKADLRQGPAVYFPRNPISTFPVILNRNVPMVAKAVNLPGFESEPIHPTSRIENLAPRSPQDRRSCHVRPRTSWPPCSEAG